MESKVCTDCGAGKSLIEFYNYPKKRANGEEYIYYQPYCKVCATKRSRKWAKENVQGRRELSRRYYNTPRGRETKKERDRKYVESGKYLKYQRENKDKFKQYRLNRQHKEHEISNAEWLACKQYFKNQCAYCGLHIDDHYNKFKGEIIWTDLHRDHVDHDGENDLSNCIPSCKSCNSSKHTFEWKEWYRDHPNFSEEKFQSILQWLEEDYLVYKDK